MPEAAKAYSFPIENIVFEVIEEEVIRDQAHLAIITERLATNLAIPW